MEWFYSKGYIIDFNKDLFTGNTFQCSLAYEEKIRPDSNFGLIYDFELETINSYTSKYRAVNKSTLLLVLSYIRLNTWVRKTDLTGHSEKSKKSKPEICNRQLVEIANDLGLSSNLVSKSLTTLEEFNFVASKAMPRFQDELGNWHTEDTIFVAPYKFRVISEGKIVQSSKEEYDYEKEIAYGIKFLQERKYSSKKFYQE